MAEALDASLPTGPTLRYVRSEPLPPVVAEVLHDIQKLMMDDVTHNNRASTIPNMPKEFICTTMVPKKKRIMKIAGESLDECQKLYQIFVPLLVSRPPHIVGKTMPPHYQLWSGNVISIEKIDSASHSNAKSIGKIGSASHSNVKSIGKIGSASHSNAKSIGKIGSASHSNAKSIGKIGSASHSNVKSIGKIGSASHSNAKSIGKIGSASHSNVKSIGKIGSASHSNAKSIGKIGSASHSNVKSIGKIGSASHSNVKSIGKIGSASHSNAKSIGKIGSASHSNAKSIGKIGSASHSNVKSIGKIGSASHSNLAVINVKEIIAREKSKFTDKPVQKYFPISTDVNEIPSKCLRNFLQSPLVCKQPSGTFLVSSHKMTITWLRSRLDKALHKYKDIKKDVQVIATIKQKDGGPLFLELKVEESEIILHDLLFLFCPAFRVSRCQLVIPVFSLLERYIIPQECKNSSGKHCLWKRITNCEKPSPHKHKTPNSPSVFEETALSEMSEVKVKPKKRKGKGKESYKASIDKIRETTPAQLRECEQCLNPASRMLLEYYYQYSHIPEDEMKQATSFVWKILNFLKGSIKENEKDNEPKILEFVESGSVPEKLKVIQPDEFDVMISIDLPDSTQCYKFLEDETFPAGYAICKVRRSKSFSRSLKRCFEKSEEFSYCLAPEQLAFGWLYSKLELAINKYKKSRQRQAELKVRRSGPAMLLEIIPSTPSMKEKLPGKISVDLVLALKLGKDDSRFAVAKRAKEEQFYKKVVKEQETPGQQRTPTDSSAGKGLARKNLKYLWRISYSAQERRYLEYVRETQQAKGVEGCQDICLKILKTICTREILKREESVICHKLSTYILKTALFHVLAESDLILDWKMDCLADRYVDLLDKLSKWQELSHFFFNNAVYLRKVFPEDAWSEKTTPKNLFHDLHATLKIQLLYRFCHIAESFKKCKREIDAKIFCSSNKRVNYILLLKAVLGGKEREEVIHPTFNKSVKPDEETRRALVKEVSEDSKVRKAARDERKGGPHSDQDSNLKRSEKKAKKSQDRHQLKEERKNWRREYSDA